MRQREPTEMIAAASDGGPSLGVEVSGLTKLFSSTGRSEGARVTAVDNITLKVKRGDFCVLLGPSGCGKTTLLRCLAGLERPSAGTIKINDRVVFDLSHNIEVEPQNRPVGMVFQNYALWPHLNVRNNVAFPLTTRPCRRRMSRNAIRARVDEVLEIMQLSQLGERRVSQLSGGQQQRVALGRAIVAGNDLVLFDEPLSNIDAKVREQLRQELRTTQQKLGFTAVYVTHDQSEAMEMADQIAVIRNGQVLQVGAPREIYNSPANANVAQFIGSANLIQGTISRAARNCASGTDSVTLRTLLGKFDVALPASCCTSQVSADDGIDALIVSRTHNWWIRRDPPEITINAWEAVVVSIAYQGAQSEYVVNIAGTLIRILSKDRPDLIIGQHVYVGVAPDECRLVDRN